MTYLFLCCLQSESYLYILYANGSSHTSCLICIFLKSVSNPVPLILFRLPIIAGLNQREACDSYQPSNKVVVTETTRGHTHAVKSPSHTSM